MPTTAFGTRRNDKGLGGLGTGAMIICSCNVLSDHDVRSIVAAAHAPRTPAQIHNCLGCSVECGRCTPTIRRIAADALPRDGALEP